jgi:flagellar hook-length control protein FliK
MKLSEAGQALVNRIQMMAAGEIKHATIRLDPPELGSLEVKVKVQNEQTHIQIVTQSAQVRDALESQSVRLREALAEQGLNLSNLDVSDQSSQYQGEQKGGDGADEDGYGSDESVDIERVDTIKPIGLVDHYV